jgi:hypothetical protein
MNELQEEILVYRYVIDIVQEAKWQVSGFDSEIEIDSRNRRWKFRPGNDTLISWSKPLACYAQYRPRTGHVTFNCIGLNTFPHYECFLLADPEFSDRVESFLNEAKKTYINERFDHLYRFR